MLIKGKLLVSGDPYINWCSISEVSSSRARPVIIPYIPGTLETSANWKCSCFSWMISKSLHEKAGLSPFPFIERKCLALGSWRVSRTDTRRYWSLVGLLGHQWTDRSLVVRAVLHSYKNYSQEPEKQEGENLEIGKCIFFLYNHQLDSLFWLVGWLVVICRSFCRGAWGH